MNGIGEVYTYRKQCKVNKGYGFYDTSKVFVFDDENGKVKVDGTFCSISREPIRQNKITIGDKEYSYVKINNLYWITENLSLPTSNSVTRNNYAWCGCYYPYSDISEIEDSLPEGWRIPTESDALDLFVENTSDNAHALQSTVYSNVWPDANNISSFNGVPSRSHNSSNSELDRGIWWLKSDTNYFLLQPNSVRLYTKSTSKICVRVCKDV